MDLESAENGCPATAPGEKKTRDCLMVGIQAAAWIAGALGTVELFVRMPLVWRLALVAAAHSVVVMVAADTAAGE